MLLPPTCAAAPPVPLAGPLAGIKGAIRARYSQSTAAKPNIAKNTEYFMFFHLGEGMIKSLPVGQGRFLCNHVLPATYVLLENPAKIEKKRHGPAAECRRPEPEESAAGPIQRDRGAHRQEGGFYGEREGSFGTAGTLSRITQTACQPQSHEFPATHPTEKYANCGTGIIFFKPSSNKRRDVMEGAARCGRGRGDSGAGGGLRLHLRRRQNQNCGGGKQTKNDQNVTKKGGS